MKINDGDLVFLFLNNISISLFKLLIIIKFKILIRFGKIQIILGIKINVIIVITQFNW